MTKLMPSRAATTVAAALAVCAPVLACPGAALAAGTSTGAGENTPLNLSPASTATHTSSGGASLVRTIVGLAIVIAVIWGLSWILRQVKSGRDPQVSSEGLASIAALTLGAGRSVHLVRAGSEYVLLGSAEHGVVPIHRYSEQEAREAGLLSGQDEPPRKRRGPLLAPRRDEAGGTAAPRTTDTRGAVAPRPGEMGRHDPMRMGAPGAGVIERLREWTVRH
jgi:flagellar protein FliO/FliZ